MVPKRFELLKFDCMDDWEILLSALDQVFKRQAMYQICFFLLRIVVAEHLWLSPNIRKCAFGRVRPAKIQISLRIRAEAQADLSLRWAHISKGTFSHDVDQILFLS